MRMSKLEEAKKRYKNRNINKTDEKSSLSKTTRSSQLENAKKRYAAKSIGLDTFQSDLSSMGKTIEGIYNGWQTPETMQNTKSSVESMQKRINAYQEYQKVYGGADLSEIASGYKTLLDEWDDRAKIYGKYKDADSYTKAMKAAEESLKIEESKKTANLDDVQKEIDSLEDILNKATEYETKIQGLKNKKNNWNYRTRGLQTETGYDTDLKATKAEYSQFLKDSGYTNADEIKGLISEKKAYKNNAAWVQKGIEMASVGDENSENYDKDFAEKSKYVPTKQPFIEFNWNNSDDEVYEYINTGKGIGDVNSSASASILTVGYEYMTDKEKATYNYYYNEFGYKKANEYLNTITEELGARKANADFKKYEDNAVKEMLYGINAGFDQFASGMKNLFNASDEYIPVNATQQLSGMIREDLSDVGPEFLGSSRGQGAYDLITTTTNMAPSILASTASNFLLPGSGVYVGSTLMGASAAGNAYQEMLNMGYDKSQARTYSTLIGVSEAGLGAAFGGISSLGGKLSGKTISAIANGVDNASGRFAITMGGKMVSEGFEEAAQEILAPFFENLALGYMKNDLSDIEWEQVAYSGVLGALSAFFLEGVGTGKSIFGENHNAKGIGANIRRDEKIGEMLDIASLNPQGSAAYDLYTKYANKGVNADNVSDLQLGRLFLNTEADTRNTLGSKKPTLSQKDQAKEIQRRLSEINAENALDKNTITEIGENIEVSKQYRDGLISEGLESAENTESHRLAVELQEKLKNGEDISSKDIERLVKANQNAIRQEEIANFTESMSKEDAELFLEQYDGKADVSEFANAFNLVKELSENNFSQDYILQHKGILTPSQVGAIYKSKVLNSDQALQTALNNLKKKHEGTDFIQGTFDDSVINYDNTAIEGKVNWNSLTTSQKRATVLLSAFSTEHGMNVKLISNGIELGINGAFKIQDNEILIDVYAGMDKVNGKDMADLIFPTLSHELVHWSENKAPEIYRKLDNYVFDTLKMTGMSEKDILQQRRDKMKKAHPGKHFTDAEVRAEVVARANEDMLTKSKEFKKFFESLSDTEKKTFIDKAKGILHELKEWLDNFLAKYKSSAWEAKTVAEFQDRIEGQIELYEQMLKSSIEANQALQKEGITGEKLAKSNTDIQLAIREEFVNEIDDWVKDGKPDGESFVLGSTGDVLQGLGAIESDIYMLSDKINEILSDHPEITIDEIKKIPQILDNPVMVLKSKKLKSRLIMFGSVKAKNGKPMLVVLDLRPHEKGFMLNDMQKVNSAYTKTETFNKTAEENGRDFVETSEVLYLDKKRTTHLLSAIGFYMPITCNQSGFIGSISYEGDNVNIKGEDFSKVIQENPVQNSDRDNLGNTLTEGQAEYFKDSKMRDENGNLLVMYRGDMNEFTVFDRKKSKHGNLYGRGFYFTKVKGHAEQYGKAKEYYLNIKNPLSPNQNNITKKQMLNFLKAIENDGEDYDLYNYGEGATAGSVLSSVWGKGDFEMIQDINAGAIGDLVAAIELFNDVNGTTYDGIILPSETVTFNSAQSKLTSNENPTDNEDIRFSMRENVEETKELVAVHNVSSEKLLKTLKLGGLPMPSIAITRAREGYNNFGDISLVFGKDTIDPEFMRRNKVYSGDAWTPTYPRIEYKVNEKATEKIREKINALVPKNVQDDLGGLHLESYNVENELNRNGDMTTSYRYNSAMKYAFLKDNDVNIELPTKEEPFYRYGEVSNSAVISFANRLVEGLKTANALHEQHSSKLMADTELLSSIAQVLNEEVMDNTDKDSEAYQKLVENPLYKPEDIDLSTVLGMLEASRRYFHSNGKTETKIDYRNAKGIIDDYFDSNSLEKEYEYWLKNLFSDVIAKEGIRNNKDLFTPSGNRRSFEALHYEHTLENVIKSMKEEGTKGIGGFGGGNIFGASTTEYGSIDEIKTDAKNRLERLPESQYDEIKKGFSDRLFELANSLPIHKDSFTALDDAANMLIEAVSKFKTKSGMANYLRTESQGWANYNDYIVDDLIQLVNEIRQMPVAYFEAKPQRAVGFDEIKAVIMPSQESYKDDLTEVKRELENLNIPILEYEYGDNNARLNALNSLEDVQFSDRESFTERVIAAQDLRDEAKQYGSRISVNYDGSVTVYHGTSMENAENIRTYGIIHKQSYFVSNKKDAEYYAKKKNKNGIVLELRIDARDLEFAAAGSELFSPLELKNVNGIYSSNLGVRYSDRETETIYDKMGETDRLLKEYEKLKADFERVQERLNLERQITHGNVLNERQIGLVAGHLRNLASSTYSKDKLTSELKDVYTYLVSSEQLAWEDIYAKCYEVAQDIMSEAKPITTTNDYAKMILHDIRHSRIKLSEAQKQEAKSVFGNRYTNAFMGKVIISNTGHALDSQWQEWAEQYPDFFDADVNEGDQITALYDIYDDLKDASEMLDEYSMEEQTRFIANEIYNGYWNVSPIRTTADKYDKKIKLLNFEHRRTMKELRDSYNERLDKKLKDQKTADRQRTKELVDKLRERKDREIAEVKQHSKERMDKYKENAERKTVIQRITANALTLNKWLTKNSKDYHIHEAMKGPVVKLLNAIDFSSKRMIEKGVPTQNDASFAEAFSEVKSMLQDATNMVEGLEELYGHELAEDIQRLVKSTYNRVGDNNYIINAMTNEELQSLDKLVRYIKKVVSEVNKFHVLNHNQGAVDLANEFMEHGDKLGNLKKQHGKMGKFFEFRNRTPYYFFKSLGRVGEKVYEAFQDGWDKLAFNAKKVIDFTEETYTSKEVKEWSKETKTFKLPQFDGKERTFEMSIAQIMALHCVSKQEDAQRHLLLGGMTLKRINKKGHVVADYENINLTISDLQTILSSLTDRQKEVADKLQNFMNTVCSEWGNEISMARFGIKQFGIPDYFPIKVSEATVPGDNTKDVDNASLFRLLNMSFTKARNVNAEQSIEIGDIFDVFAQHASDMAKYNALALPVLDFNKFYSIHGKDMANKEFGVVKTLKSVFGDEANGYIRRFVRDLNGSQNVSRDVIGNTFFKNAKVAAVAANLRVVLLQPTAFYKASAVLDNKYLIKAGAYIKVEPISMVKKLKKAIDNAEKYCGIVQWKSLGYYDTDISKGLTEKIKHAESVKDKVIDKSLKGAEIADKVTFGTLWVACEFEVRDTRKELKVGSEEFYNAVAKRLRDVIYATQVVDSTMTRSDMMRSSDRLDKMYTTFGSEPTIAYNMLLDVVSQYANDQKEFGIKEAVKKNANKARKVATAYVVTNAMAALVESAFDAFREDDDEEMDIAEFLKLYFKNFALDMSIGNKLPVIKEAYSVMQGYSSSRMDTQWMQYLQYALNSKKPEKKVKYMIQFMSQISGLPFYNAYRDIMATLNKLDIFTAEELGEMLEDFFE